MRFRFFRRAGALLLALILTLSIVPAAMAAEGDEQGKVTAMTVTAAKSTMTTAEKTTTLTAKFTVAGGGAKTVTWSVDNESVGTLSTLSETASGQSTNTFTALKAGTVTVTATCGDASASCIITVTDPPALTALSLEKDMTLTVGKSASLIAKVTYNTAAGISSAEIVWTTGTSGIVRLVTPPEKTSQTTLTADLIALKKGTTTVTVSCGSFKDSVTITVNDPDPVYAERVEVKPETLPLQVGESGNLTAKVTMTDKSTNSDVTWKSSDSSIASVDASSGKVTAKSEGDATITATSKVKDSNKNDVSGTCTVTVTAAPTVAVTGVSISGGAQKTLGLNEKLQLTAVVAPENATNKNVTWSSSKTNIATVSAGGMLTAGSEEGETTITAATEDGGYTATCTVKVQRVIKPVTRITIDPVFPVVASSRGKELSLERPASSAKLTAVVYPADAANKDVVWTSSDEQVVTVDETGKVTAVAPGEAKVTVNSAADPENSNLEDSCKVMVSGITLSESSVVLKVGQSASVIANGYGNANVRLLWESRDATVASGGGNKVVGISVGTTTIRVYAPNTNYEQTVQVTVVENTIPVKGLSVDAGQMLYFSSLLSSVNAAIRNDAKDGTLSVQSITGITLSTKEGIVHYGYVSPDTPNHGVGGSEVYYDSPNTSRGQQGISDLKYIPASGFSGTATIDFAATTNKSDTYNITVYVTVNSSGDVMLSTAVDRPLALTAKEFRDICQLKNGRSASYVTFTQPSASKGTLYYNYSGAGQWSQKVDGTTKYYLSSTPSLEKVTFVPAQNYTGTVSIPYRCTDTTGSSYSGTMTISVYANGGSAIGGVQYTTGVNQRVTLNASDFNSAWRESNSGTLSYILFESLPAVSEGVLYYNYTSSSSQKVNTSTNYYRNSTSPRISGITFVPASNFSGVVTIPYIGYDSSGQTDEDNLVITVSDAAGAVYYTTGVDDPVTFRAEDFNEACLRANGASLNYVMFTVPSSSVGTLYRNYRSSSNPGTRISYSASARYYRGGTPNLSDITFVPKSRYEGVVSIPFSGKDANGDVFEGKVNISVGQGTGRVVRYATASGGVVRFSANDFNIACRTATGDDLNYVSFELPASRYGTLYYQYNTARGSGTLVSSSSTYYRSGSGRLVDDLYFVTANVNGTASFLYTARSTGGTQFTGTVEIAIGNAALDSGYSNGTYYIGSSAPIALRTQDFEQACQTAIGGALSYIRFTSLPSDSVGRLYLNYASPSRPGGEATTTSNYTVSSGLTIGQLSFVPKAGYQGQVQIPYTGYTAQGRSFSSSVVINISTSYCATPFYDVDAGWDWAKPSVEFLRYEGISNGYSDGSFRPSRSISRGEFTLMVCRAFGFDTTAKVSSFPDVPAGSPYAGAVATAKSMGIVEGSGGRFRPDSPITRQSAMAIICRAMKAAGKKVPATGGSTLSAFKDHAQIASHARESVAALVSLGVVQGSTDLRINPTRSISRAEMAVILHRVLTL